MRLSGRAGGAGSIGSTCTGGGGGGGFAGGRIPIIPSWPTTERCYFGTPLSGRIRSFGTPRATDDNRARQHSNCATLQANLAMVLDQSVRAAVSLRGAADELHEHNKHSASVSGFPLRAVPRVVPAGQTLRYQVGERVLCLVGERRPCGSCARGTCGQTQRHCGRCSRRRRSEWVRATIVAMHYSEPGFPRGHTAPYLVQLERGPRLFLTEDDARLVVREADGLLRPRVLRPRLMQASAYRAIDAAVLAAAERTALSHSLSGACAQHGAQAQVSETSLHAAAMARLAHEFDELPFEMVRGLAAAPPAASAAVLLKLLRGEPIRDLAALKASAATMATTAATTVSTTAAEAEAEAEAEVEAEVEATIAGLAALAVCHAAAQHASRPSSEAEAPQKRRRLRFPIDTLHRGGIVPAFGTGWV